MNRRNDIKSLAHELADYGLCGAGGDQDSNQQWWGADCVRCAAYIMRKEGIAEHDGIAVAELESMAEKMTAMGAHLAAFDEGENHYTITTEDGKTRNIDILWDDDWGNIRSCFDDDGNEYPAWGDANDNSRIVKVTMEFGIHEIVEDPLEWAAKRVWPLVDDMEG